MGMLRILQFGLWTVRHVPLPLTRLLPYLFGPPFYLFSPEKRRAIAANQRHVLGTTSPWRLQWQALRVIVNNFHNYHLFVRSSLLSNDEIRDTIVLKGDEYLSAALARGKGVIVIGAHIAGYNILAPFGSLRAQPAGALVEPLEPPELYEFVGRLRNRTGLALIPADRSASQPAMRLLRANGLLIIAGDRYLGSNGMLVSFFGAPAYLPHGPIVLALRSGATILPTMLRFQRDGRLYTEVLPPLELCDTGRLRDDIIVNMSRLAAALERTIAAVPEQWVMTEPVWEEDKLSAAANGNQTARLWHLIGRGITPAIGLFRRARRRTSHRN